MDEHTPAVGVCACCSQQFKVPMTAHEDRRRSDHKCKREDNSQPSTKR